jgi:O-antigen ligase
LRHGNRFEVFGAREAHNAGNSSRCLEGVADMTVDPGTARARWRAKHRDTQPSRSAFSSVSDDKFDEGSQSLGGPRMLRKSSAIARQSGAISMRTIITAFLIIAIILIELLIGGTRLVFSLPSYTILALVALATAFVRPDPERRPSRLCLGVSCVFFAYILGRAALSPVQYLWWTDFYMVLGCLTVYFLTAYYVTDPRRRAAVIWALLALAVVEILIGLHQFTAGDGWMPFGFIRAGIGRRASGTLISSIHLAGYLEVVGLFGLSYALWSTWKTWARILAGYIGLMCYVGVAITGSRGGYLSSLFSLIVFGAICLYTVRKVRPRKFAAAAAITAIAIAGSVIIGVGIMSRSELLRTRLSGIPQQFEKNGLDIRIYNWQATLDQFQVSPVFGTGAGTHLYYGRLFRRVRLQPDPIHAHSDYLELLAEYGIIGAIGMAAFLIVHIGRGWRNYRAVLKHDLHDVSEWEPARNDSLALYIGALSAISAYLAHSVVDFNLHIPGHALIFAFIFGIVASPVYGAPPKPRPKGSIAFRWALPILGVWMILGGTPRFAGEYWAERARVALRDFEFEDSIRYAQQALTFETDNPELYFHLGSAHRGTALFADDQSVRAAHMKLAVEAYTRGLEVFPYDLHTLTRLGQALDALGLFKQAEAIYLKTLELDPNLGRAHAYYARHLAIVGRQEEAEARLKIARERAFNDDVSGIIQGTTLDPQFANQ